MKTSKIAILLLFISSFSFAQSKEGYNLVWEDNFSGASLDTVSWSHELAQPGWVNNELQRYTDANVEFADGNLLIIAKEENNE